MTVKTKSGMSSANGSSPSVGKSDPRILLIVRLASCAKDLRDGLRSCQHEEIFNRNLPVPSRRREYDYDDSMTAE